jgi:hypothetical protein
VITGPVNSQAFWQKQVTHFTIYRHNIDIRKGRTSDDPAFKIFLNSHPIPGWGYPLSKPDERFFGGLRQGKCNPWLSTGTLGRFPGTVLLTTQGQAVRSENYRGFFLTLGIALLFIVITVIYRDHVEVWLKIKKTRRKDSLPLKSKVPD